MKATEQSAKAPSPRIGRSATLRALLPRRGTGAPSPRRPAAALLAAALLLLAAAPPASADSRIGVSGPRAGGLASPIGVAVSQREGGDLYLTDGVQNQRIDQFQAAGPFVRAFGWDVVPGAVSGTGTLTAGSNLISDATATAGAFLPGEEITGTGIPAGTVILGGQSAAEEQAVVTLSQPATAPGTAVALTATAGPGNLPTNELQKLTITATAGQYKLSFSSLNPGSATETTPSLAYNASATEVQQALENLANLGAGNVSVSEGPGDEKGQHPYLVEFKGRYADVNVHPLTTTNLSLGGGSPSSAATVATARQGAGALETCTTLCWSEGFEQRPPERAAGEGSEPGQFASNPDAIAVDNSCAQQEPPLSGAACETFDPSYGDVYVVDQNNFRVEKFGPAGEFLLMLGGEVDKGPHHPGDLCTAAYLAEGDTCGAGVPGTGPAHFYQSGSLSWGGYGNNSIAVGPDGTLYVGDYGRIQEIKADGTFAGEFVLPVGGGEEPQFVTALALDRAGNIFARSTVTEPGTFGVKILRQVPGVREFDGAHNLLRSFDAEAGSEPAYIALDEQGELVVFDRNGEGAEPRAGEYQFRAYRPTGALYAVFASAQVQSFHGGGTVEGIAVGSGNLYATAHGPEGAHIAVVPLPQPGPPIVEEEHLTDLQPTTATLHAIVNPKQFDTKYQFQYITDAKFKEDGDSFGAGTQSAPSTPADLGSVDRRDPVQAAISPLTPRTLYHYRVVAENECHGPPPSAACIAAPEATFETLPDVSVRDFTTQIVGPELVELKAELNPNNSPTKAKYTIHYGKEEENYTLGSCQGELEVGTEFEPVSCTFTGLQPNTEYHYQLLAHDEYGDEKTTDATFTTELSQAEERAAEDCPLNGSVAGVSRSTLREQNNSLSLPDCRAYEQVSPTFKNAFSAFAGELAPSGERVLFTSSGAFAGAAQNTPPYPTQYVARRTPSGWLTQAAVGRPAGLGYEPEYAWDFSPELDRWVFAEGPGLSSQAHQEATSGALYMGSSPAAGFLPASPTLKPEGAPWSLEAFTRPAAQSADLSTLFLETNLRLLPAPADERPNDAFGSNHTRIYRISGAGGPSPTLGLSAEVPTGLVGLSCLMNSPGPGQNLPGLRPGGASADGSTLFYADPIEVVSGAACGQGAPNPIALFARTGEAPPVRLDAPPASQCHSPSPCASASPANPGFDGASPDGRLAWFNTARPLLDSDTDATPDLYLAKLEANGQLEELIQASKGESEPGTTEGHGADLRGPVAVSADGTTAAFVATGVLTTHPNSVGESATQGADNLYLYDAQSAETRFVARLCFGPEESGSVKDSSCPADLARGENQTNGNDAILWSLLSPAEAHLTPDGRFLLFSSFGRLAPGDTDSAEDVYRYDLQTGQLTRVSFGHRGNDANGNNDAFPDFIGTSRGTFDHAAAQELAEDPSRSISADGSTVIFRTAAPLVSRDTDLGSNPGCGTGSETGCDVYEWEQAGHGTCTEPGGCVSLLSGGLDTHGVRTAVISSSGEDVAFATPAGPAPADTDGVGDIYDARENGGFLYTPPPIPCGGNEICHESTPPPPALPKIVTPEFVGPGNEKTQLGCGKDRHRVKKHGQVRCVLNKPHKKHHHKAKHKRAARANRGGNK